MRMMSRKGGRIAGALGAAALALAVVPPAGADSLRFQATAAADGARLSLTIPGATVVDQIIDGGGPVAQATADSLGNSSALAAQPYPGELAIIGPGLGASLIGAPQPPAYPFIATSRYPTVPEQTVEPNPGYRLEARSSEASSEATARSGAADETTKVLLSEATARVGAEGDLVKAEAANRVEALTVSPLSIGAVVSSAQVARRPDADPERQSSLVVAGVSIAGQPVGFTEDGFVGAGTATPLPPSDPLLAALASGGVAVTYLKAEPTATGVVAPGLRIVAIQDVPGAGRTATVALTLGRASASVAASTEAVALPADKPVTPDDQPAEPGPAATSAAAPPAAVPAVESTPAPVVTSTVGFDSALGAVPYAPEVTAELASGADGLPSGAAAQAAVPAPQRIQLAGGPPLTGPIEAGRTFYPVLVAVGALAFGGMQIIRTVGVKS